LVTALLPQSATVTPNNLGPINIPDALPPDLRAFLDQVRTMPRNRDHRLKILKDEYDSDSGIIEKFRPVNVKDEFWATTKELMLHMNTTRVAVRSLNGVYSGHQTRRITGEGKFVEELQAFANSHAYKTAAAVRFTDAVLFGTSATSPYWDPDIETLETVVHDPVTTRLWGAPANVKKLLALVEQDPHGRWLRFITAMGSGTVFAQNLPDTPRLAMYEPALKTILASVAYGEDRRAHGEVCGASLVRETPGYNRILTNCYYCLGLLIKWQSRSLLTIMSGDKGSADSLKGKITQINGTTALLLDQGATAQFISPAAKFSEILQVIASYLNFLAVLLGIPKSVFDAQDNVSAQSARLEGAPLLSTMRKLARDFEAYEADFLLRSANYLHLLRDQVQMTIGELMKLYQISVRIEPWDYTNDTNANAANIVQLVNAGIVRLQDAIRDANPQLTDDEISAMVESKQNELNRTMEAKLSQNQPPPDPPLQEAA
jgi:hypothetical protein